MGDPVFRTESTLTFYVNGREVRIRLALRRSL